MLKNYLMVTLRNLWRNKVYASINIAGLALGISSCILILIFVEHELSFDRFHSKSDQIYRLCEVQKFEGMTAQNVALSMYPMGPALQKDFPEIKEFVRFVSQDQVQMLTDGAPYFSEKIYFVDEKALEMFDFKLLHGDPKTVLDEPNSVVLTPKNARILFQSTNPVGKTVKLKVEEGYKNFKVTGVLEEIPKNSHLQFEALFSLSSVEEESWKEGWGNNWLVTYLYLDKNADLEKLHEAFPAFLRKYMEEDGASQYELFLQNLSEVHLGSTDITHDYQNVSKFDGKYIYIFIILAIFVLVIACVNFINLSTARSVKRAKEVGIRKTLGAYKSQLVGQFLSESIVFAFIAMFLSVFLVELSLPYLSNLIQRDLSLQFFTNPLMLPILLSGALLVGFLSGVYPAFFISAFEATRVLKGNLENKRVKFSLRNVLVVSQFAIATFLIVSTFIVVKQLDFMMNKDIGYNKEHVVIVPMNRTINEKFDAFKSDLLKSPAIIQVSASGQRLGNNIHQTSVKFKGENTEERGLTSSFLNIDYDYLKLYNIKLLEGRGFSKEFGQDQQKSFIINEAMRKELGLKSGVDAKFGLSWVDTLGTIIGVTENFNFNSLHHTVQPLCMFVNNDWGYSELSVKVDAQNIKEAMAYLEKSWKTFEPELPFEYSFLDEHFENLYTSERQVSQVVSIFTFLAIVVACLGLYGLASFITQQRTKEIGIRKILGASVSQILFLLSGDFLRLVVIASIIALPMTYWAIQQWLQNYAFRTSISWWVFVLPLFIILGIALLTVSYQTLKTSRVNPADTLRYE